MLITVRGYHTPLEDLIKDPHCWPLDADHDNDEPVDCGGRCLTVRESLRESESV